MTLLAIIQSAADLIGVTRPTTVVSSSDRNVRTLLALANVEGEELLERYAWPETNKQATFTTVAAELQGTLVSIAADFGYIVNGTMWNRTLNQPVDGPLTPQERQQMASGSVTGPFHDFYIRGASLYLFPTPTAGQSVYFEYQSNLWCQSSGGTGQTAWAADTDTGILDESLMKLGVVWRFKKKNGLDYAEDFRTYEQKLANATSRAGGKRTLDMSGRRMIPRGVTTPEGSWNI